MSSSTNTSAPGADGPGSPTAPGADGPGSAAGSSPADRGGTWAVRPRGLWLVTSLELRQRLRSKRWYAALAVWTLVLLGIGGLGLAPTLHTARWEDLEPVAAMVFSLQIVLVLFAMLLVVPALSAGSINGDRTAGTLATLQASLLSAAEIVLGKLLAGFLTGLAFVVLALPSVLPIALLGGISPGFFLRTILVIVVLTLCVTAMGLGLSALTVRQLGSVVLAYVIVLGTTAVLPIAWGVSAVLLQEERELTSYYTEHSTSPVSGQNEDGTPADGEARCVEETFTQSVPRLDLTLPLMWGNPVVLLAEAAPPTPEDLRHTGQEPATVLGILKMGMRSAATITHPAHTVWCDPQDAGYPAHLGDVPDRPLWPMGIGLWLLAGGLSVVVATRTLAVPITRLGTGTRIA